jgi:hypothetical protein
MDEKTIVLTMYGIGEDINNVTVTLFNAGGYGYTTVQDYCNNINGLELKDDNWIFAFTVKENEKFRLEKPVRCDLEILSSLDDYAIQMVLREVDSLVLRTALISANKNILRAVLRNVSKRSAKMLIEDMKYFTFSMPKEEIKKAQSQIVDVIRHLEMTGEITVPKFSQNEKNNNREQQI